MLIALDFTTLVADTIERLIGSDGSPYEKRVDAKGRVTSDKCIADEVPFEELPEGWAWARLGAAFTMQAGKNIKTSLLSDKQTEEAPYPCFGGNGIRGFVSRPNANGDYPIIGRQGALCGNIKRATGQFYATEHAVLVTCFSNTDTAWACCFLEALNLNQYATATAQPGLAVSKISDVLTPVPPLAEQRRIVERVNELMPLVEEYGGLEDAREALDAALPGRLRKSVLQLAVQGGLVPQDPTDEPAGALLERIRGQRRQLVAEKKMKAPKGGESIIFAGSDGRRYEKRVDARGRESDPVCIEDEIPFEIPEGWEWARFSTLINLAPGTSYKKHEVTSQGIRILRGGNILENGSLTTGTDDVFLDYGHVVPSAQVQVGDVLYVASTGSKKVIGKPGFVSREMPNTQIGAFLRIARPLACQGWCWLIFFSDLYRSRIRELSTGTNINNVKESYVLNLLVPLPPLPEQRRIFERLEMLRNAND